MQTIITTKPLTMKKNQSSKFFFLLILATALYLKVEKTEEACAYVDEGEASKLTCYELLIIDDSGQWSTIDCLTCKRIGNVLNLGNKRECRP
jgi:hypothetical protein